MKRPVDYTSHAADFSSSHSPLRRQLLCLLALSPLSASIGAQAAAQAVVVSKLHCFTLRVTELERSLNFYQTLFGMPVLARESGVVSLRVGAGPQFLTLQECQPGETPGIAHIGLSVLDFSVDTVASLLAARGLRERATAPASAELLNASLQFWRAPAPDSGVFLTDREGLLLQLCAPTWCGVAGACVTPEPALTPGLLQLNDINHFTNYMTNAPAANLFYLELFGLQYQSYQGPTMPTIGVGDGRQFLMFVGGAREETPQTPARIDHVSLSVENFDVERILATLTQFGLSARAEPSVTPALSHWVSMRMPNRGGAEGGTPELYFADPDGLHIQLQHLDYCGGGGYLGDTCPALP
jgi:catechol 2,3-dioxygenase-like lactoylglutathione lyase family enzyme